MEMPRRCSSSNRSVSVPVMYRTSVVLPWSTCPAVPMVSAICRSSNRSPYGVQDRLLVPVEQRAAAAPGDRGGNVHREVWCGLGEPFGQEVGAGFDLFGRGVEHLEGREFL